MKTLQQIIKEVKALSTLDELVTYVNANIDLHKQDISLLEQSLGPRSFVTPTPGYKVPLVALFVYIFQYSTDIKQLDDFKNNIHIPVELLTQHFKLENVALAFFDIDGYLISILRKNKESQYYQDWSSSFSIEEE